MSGVGRGKEEETGISRKWSGLKKLRSEKRERSGQRIKNLEQTFSKLKMLNHKIYPGTNTLNSNTLKSIMHFIGGGEYKKIFRCIDLAVIVSGSLAWH